jgi:hypothetical protein
MPLRRREERFARWYRCAVDADMDLHHAPEIDGHAIVEWVLGLGVDAYGM